MASPFESNVFSSVPTSAQEQVAAVKKGNFDFSDFSDWETPTFGWELIFLSVFLCVIFLYALSLGREKITSLLVTTYIAAGISALVPMSVGRSFSLYPIVNFRVVLFLTIFVVTYVVVVKSAIVSSLVSLSLAFWQQFILTLAVVGMLASVLFVALPAVGFGQGFHMLFAADWSRVAWFAAPLILLFLFTRGPSRFNYS